MNSFALIADAAASATASFSDSIPLPLVFALVVLVSIGAAVFLCGKIFLAPAKPAVVSTDLPQGNPKQAFCSKCGKEILQDAAFCASCGAPINGNVTGQSQHIIFVRDDDRLSWGVISLIWIFACFPLVGGWVVIILSSVLYYSWKKDYPKKARSVNIHGWLAFLFGNFLFFYGCGSMCSAFLRNLETIK